MVKNIFRIILLVLTHFGCTPPEGQIEQINIKAETIIESISTRLPGNIFLKGNILIMIDPFSNEGFIRLFNTSNSAEMAKAGKIGRGPEEFITPKGSQIFDNHLIIFDPNLNSVGYFNLDSIINGKNPLMRIDKNENYEHLSGFIKVDSGLSVGADYSDKPLKLIYATNNLMDEFGKYPIDEKIGNSL